MNGKHFLTLALYAVLEQSFYYPLTLVLACSFGIDAPLFAGAVWAACAWLGSLLAQWRYSRRKISALLLAAAIGALLSLFLLQPGWQWGITALLGAWLAHQGLTRMSKDTRLLQFPPAMLISLAAYAVLAVVMRVSATYGAHSHSFYLMGLLALITFSFQMHDRQLASAALDRSSRSAGREVRIANRLWTVLFLVVIWIASRFGDWYGFFLRLRDLLFHWLARLLDHGHSKPEPAQQPQPVQPPETKLPPPGKTPRWMELLEHIVTIAFIVLLCTAGLALLVWGIYKLAPKLKQAWRSLAAYFASYRNPEAGEIGYIDERTKLERDKTSRKASAHGKGRKTKQTDESEASGIRARYRQLLRAAVKAGYRYRSSATPSEIEREFTDSDNPLAAELRQLTPEYNEIRYNTEPHTKRGRY